jgi:predicted Rossmann-fold nucleotide-binding protein
VVLPGGLGTLDELTEALTLIQTGKILQFPVVLMGSGYWKPFLDLLREMVAVGTVAATDLDLFLVTDTVSEAMAHIEHHAIRRFGLKRRQYPAPHKWLGEEPFASSK